VHNNECFGSASWRLFCVAVHEETAPSERIGARGEAPAAVRKANRLHVWIVLTVTASRTTVSHELAVWQQFPRFLRVTPQD